MASMTAEQFSDQDDIVKSMASLSGTLDELDTTHGPMVRQVETEAMRQIAGIVQKMHAVVAMKLGNAPTKPMVTPTTGATTQHQ